MSKILRAVADARLRLFYSGPVYVPGYPYAPWKKWLVLALVSTLVFVGYFFMYRTA